MTNEQNKPLDDIKWNNYKIGARPQEEVHPENLNESNMKKTSSKYSYLE